MNLYKYSYVSKYYPAATNVDQIIFSIFRFTATVCLGLSAIYHTLMKNFAGISVSYLLLDSVSIVNLTLGSFISGIYVVINCEPDLQRLYWAMTSTLSVATINIFLSPKLQNRKYRSLRLESLPVPLYMASHRWFVGSVYSG